MKNTVLLKKTDKIATIFFNRPEQKNAFDAALANEFAAALEDAMKDKNITTIILRGEGDMFMVGGDIKLFFSNRENMTPVLTEMGGAVVKIMSLFEKCNKPILAAVHGSVAGIGLSFMLCADLVIAQEGTNFLTAYTQLALTPDGAMTYHLPRLVGAHKAAELLLLNEQFDAKVAKELGLINWVVPGDQFEAKIKTISEKLATGPVLAYARVRHLLKNTWQNSFLEQVNQELRAFRDSTETKDFKIGVSAFVNKKQPNFEGT